MQFVSWGLLRVLFFFLKPLDLSLHENPHYPLLDA